ncbi:SWIM zinc finger family protein [Desulfomicrobium apsheronum]|uniref:SWIM zinc finger family protein n=1 Tax=Desulfomicrobium apsheronum TaxID=52560 RepID=UPI001160C476
MFFRARPTGTARWIADKNPRETTAIDEAGEFECTCTCPCSDGVCKHAVATRSNAVSCRNSIR